MYMYSYIALRGRNICSKHREVVSVILRLMSNKNAGARLLDGVKLSIYDVHAQWAIAGSQDGPELL